MVEFHTRVRWSRSPGMPIMSRVLVIARGRRVSLTPCRLCSLSGYHLF
jgi:hypothetical protein